MVWVDEGCCRETELREEWVGDEDEPGEDGEMKRHEDRIILSSVNSFNHYQQ